MNDASDAVTPSSDPHPSGMIEQVRSLIQSVKDFVHLAPSWRRKINSAATLPSDFYRVGALVLDDHEWLAKTARVTGPEVRDAVDGSNGLVILATELELLAKGLRSTAAARLGHVGQRLLLAYAVARQHNRNEDAEQIGQIAHMEAMLRARRRRGRRKAGRAAPEETPAQAPEPPES